MPTVDGTDLNGNPVRMIVANGVKSESWLNGDEYKWFKNGLSYASTQTRAIPGLSVIEPEDLYMVIWAVIRGAMVYGTGEEMTKALKIHDTEPFPFYRKE